MSKTNQYFMCGILLSYNTYLETKTGDTIEDVLKNTDDIEGIFTGRNGDFVIIGRILEIVDGKSSEPLVVPQLLAEEESLTKVTIEEKFGITGEYHYYFIKK
jgi:hypothetical protein